MQPEHYRRAQLAVAELKAAMVGVLKQYPQGLKNSEIGRSLGIYAGHKGHEGHISRTLLGILEQEGVIEQLQNQTWCIRQHGPRPTE